MMFQINLKAWPVFYHYLTIMQENEIINKHYFNKNKEILTM